MHLKRQMMFTVIRPQITIYGKSIVFIITTLKVISEMKLPKAQKKVK